MRSMIAAGVLVVLVASGAGADSSSVTVPLLAVGRQVPLPRGLGTLVLRGHAPGAGDLGFSLQLASGTTLVFEDDPNVKDTCHFGVDLQYGRSRECTAWLRQEKSVVRFSLEWKETAALALTVSDDSPTCPIVHEDAVSSEVACNLGFIPFAWGPIRVSRGWLFVDGTDMSQRQLLLRYLSEDDHQAHSIAFMRHNTQSIALGMAKIILVWSGGPNDNDELSETILHIFLIGGDRSAQDVGRFFSSYFHARMRLYVD